jgi:pSer/pThr/pTyr-binding forkhead associated (FHA) protein
VVLPALSQPVGLLAVSPPFVKMRKARDVPASSARTGGNEYDVVRDLERMISRFHCEIHKRDGKFFLIDCGSANGTRVDGERAKPGTPMRVKTGERLELGGRAR